MKEYMEIGPCPSNETCAQVGQDNFIVEAKKEMSAYVDQLYRTFPEVLNMGINFKSKWFPHDFGTYGEVCIFWDADNEKADSYVYEIEKQLPEFWDEEALAELERE